MQMYLSVDYSMMDEFGLKCDFDWIELPMSEEQPSSSQATAAGGGELPDILSIENIDVDLLPEHPEGQ